jgi:hypothetical protein
MCDKKEVFPILYDIISSLPKEMIELIVSYIYEPEGKITEIFTHSDDFSPILNVLFLSESCFVITRYYLGRCVFETYTSEETNKYKLINYFYSDYASPRKLIRKSDVEYASIGTHIVNFYCPFVSVDKVDNSIKHIHEFHVFKGDYRDIPRDVLFIKNSPYFFLLTDKSVKLYNSSMYKQRKSTQIFILKDRCGQHIEANFIGLITRDDRNFIVLSCPGKIKIYLFDDHSSQIPACTFVGEFHVNFVPYGMNVYGERIIFKDINNNLFIETLGESIHEMCIECSGDIYSIDDTTFITENEDRITIWRQKGFSYASDRMTKYEHHSPKVAGIFGYNVYMSVNDDQVLTQRVVKYR